MKKTSLLIAAVLVAASADNLRHYGTDGTAVWLDKPAQGGILFVR